MFGVLHDGKTCYAGSAECLRWLQEKGNKRIIIISNSSKRRYDTVDHLHSLNCGMCTHLDIADVVDGVAAISIFTSGQLVYDGLRALERAETDLTIFEDLIGPSARCVFCFGNGDDDASYISSAGLRSTNVENADFLLARGLFQTVGENEMPLSFVNGDEADSILKIASERKLPMIVANPDLIRPDGNLSPMPGQLADRYESHFSGRTLRIGKPHSAIYSAVFSTLRDIGITDKSQIAAVGDSLFHDVLGAHSAGIDSIFVTGGIHCDELNVPQGMHLPPKASDLASFFAKYEASVSPPKFAIPGFTLLDAPSLSS